MFGRILFYAKPPATPPRPTLLHAHLDKGLAAMARTDGLLVVTEAYDVLPVAVVRLLGSLPPDATVEDLLAAFATRASVDAAPEGQ